MKLFRHFLIIAAILAIIPTSSDCKDMQAKVDEVLQRFQLRDGQTVEWLAELGPDAVPVLVEKLGTYEFPGAILKALAELKDKRATLPLTKYLYKHEPFSSTLGEHSAERNMTLRTLREIEDQRAEDPLMRIVRSEATLTETRLLAAAAVARFGTVPAKEECQKFIMNIWHTVSAIPGKKLTLPHYNLMTVWSAVREAMLEVDTREAFGILSSFLKDNSELHLFHKEIVSAFIRKQKREPLARKQKSEFLTALHGCCTDETQYPLTRLYCIESLWKADMASAAQISEYLDSLAKADTEGDTRNSVRLIRKKIASEQ